MNADRIYEHWMWRPQNQTNVEGGDVKPKLSELILRIARRGLKSEEYAHSVVMHPLVFLAHVAWNRHTKSPDYLQDTYRRELADFNIPEEKLRRELVADDWGVLLHGMLEYKKLHFPDDMRVITACGYTPRGTVRVEWKPQGDPRDESVPEGTSRAYNTDLAHYLNEDGDIPEEIPSEARQLASFLALIVDEVTSEFPRTDRGVDTGIRCQRKGCPGMVNGALDDRESEVHWYCLECGDMGVISGWQGTKWDSAGAD